MEWLYRMIQEPRRLAGRYLRDLCQFTPAILDQWWRLHMRPCRARRTPPSSVVVREPTWRRIQVPERFDREAIARAAPIWEEEEGLRHCLVELGNNKFIDSTAISVLLRLEKKLRRNDRHLILLEPNDSVQAALEWMGLENHFLTADDILEARQVIRARSEKKHKQEQAQNLKLEAALREEAA
jgi:anti-anti-sigma factor